MFINKCLGFKWKFILRERKKKKWIKACELALYVVAVLYYPMDEEIRERFP